MQVLMWTALYPEMTESIMAMACGAAVPVAGIAWHIIGRKIIESDTRFHGGDYYSNPEPLRGLQVARMVGHMTYLSWSGRCSRSSAVAGAATRRQFEIDSCFEYRDRNLQTVRRQLLSAYRRRWTRWTSRSSSDRRRRCEVAREDIARFRFDRLAFPVRGSRSHRRAIRLGGRQCA
jgi:hypothetical protein